MARLIDADKLHYIKVIILHQTKEEATEKQDVVVFAKEIDKAPTVDAVQVVRCKDCKHRDEEYTDQFGGIWCDMHGEVEISKNYFCASGEQKDVDTDAVD